MTSRIGKPDTDADIQLRACLDADVVRSFVMVAGAGSGKTTSLIKALSHLAQRRGAALRRLGQQIACITYTDVAVNEIWGDVGNAPLFHVSTIHSFLWSVIAPFQADLRDWVRGRIDEKIADAHERIAKPGTQVRTRERLALDIERYIAQLASLAQAKKFTYGTGSDYAKGTLGHDDVLRAGPELITARPLLQSLIASRFPFVFVDESQDTNPTVVAALQVIEANTDLCLGFFGDPMQKIYTTGAGPIAPGDNWDGIEKPENFRCPRRVLDVINNIRREDDGLEQTRGKTAEIDGVQQPVEGTARLFILPADGRRTERLQEVRQWLARQNADPLWLSDDQSADVRLLVLVHRMAARRLGFPTIYGALNDDAPTSLKDGLLDGTAWVLRPFLPYVLPLVLASRAGDDFSVMAALRQNCPLLSKERLSNENAATSLRSLREAVGGLVELLSDGSTATIREVIEFVRDHELYTLDDRFTSHLAVREDDDAEESIEDSAVRAFLAANAAELWGYLSYIEGSSPFSTQQGVKGAEFDRVMVVLDDEEGAYNLFSYGKYFGITPLSATDSKNIADGVDSVLGRTRRLFYVCCSRALQDLAVVLFVPDPHQAKEVVVARNMFLAADVLTSADLELIEA
jgi:DNA helicase-2/ATP-dependent DNA helicase PcrA